MKPAAWRLAVTAGLFLAWLGYLAFLALTTRDVVVLSRPQFTISQVDVIAQRTGADAFLVTKVLYPHDAEKQAEWKGKTITVANIAKCQLYLARNGGQPVPPDEGKPYLLPLQSVPGDDPARFEVVPIPPSPGFASGPPRIYPADEEVIRQYHAIPKP
jgi:hypothetical protein